MRSLHVSVVDRQIKFVFLFDTFKKIHNNKSLELYVVSTDNIWNNDIEMQSQIAFEEIPL